MDTQFTPEQLDINYKKHDLSYLDNTTYEYIEVPKGFWVNCGKLLDINPQRDQEPEILQSSSVNDVCGVANVVTVKQVKSSIEVNTLDTSTTHKAPEPGKVAKLSGSDLGTELLPSAKVSIPVCDNVADTTPETQGQRPGSYPGGSTSQSSITDDQPKAILNSTHLNPPPSAASSICEPPDNSEFQANPYLRDIENFIRKGGKSLDEICKEFGLSEMMALKGVNELMKKHRVWFCKSDKKIYFGLDRNPSPIKSDEPLDIGV